MLQTGDIRKAVDARKRWGQSLDGMPADASAQKDGILTVKGLTQTSW